MIKKIAIVSTMLLICGLVLNFGHAQATEIKIRNAGFEYQTIGDDDFNNGYIRAWHPYTEGWASFGYGVWNPTIYDYPATDDYSGEAPEGVNVGYIDIFSGTGIVGIEQTLSATLTANTTYELQVEIGNTNTNWYPGFPGYEIQLLAGDEDVLLASNDSVPQDLVDEGFEGKFFTSTLSFIAQSDHPSLGEALTIRLLNTNKSEGQEVDFDNVRLTATSVPEPATMLLLGTGLVGLVGLRRKFRS